MKTRRLRRKRKLSRNPWVLSSLLVLITLISIFAVVTYLNQPQSPPEPPKKAATEYFSFSDIGAQGDNITGSIVRVRLLHFSITAAGGDANHLNIFASGMADPNEYANLNITSNATIYVDIEMSYPYQIAKQGTVYPITIKLYCKEAEGNVTLGIPESNFFPA